MVSLTFMCVSVLKYAFSSRFRKAMYLSYACHATGAERCFHVKRISGLKGLGGKATCLHRRKQGYRIRKLFDSLEWHHVVSEVGCLPNVLEVVIQSANALTRRYCLSGSVALASPQIWCHMVVMLSVKPQSRMISG
jgi:hypothetical protein